MLSLFEITNMQMKLTLAAIVIFSVLVSCKNSGSGNGTATFCDTACLKDSIKFIKEASKLQPFVIIQPGNCKIDSLKWGRIGYRRSIAFTSKLKINKEFTKVFYNDTAYIWLMFNSCETGQGFLYKLPFRSDASMTITSRAINNLDKKFSVADGIAAWTDRGNIFLEDMATQKKAMMTFGVPINDMDFEAIHETLDSVNITPTHIWAKFKVGQKWEEKGKDIVFK
jgi:hypothetical protein